MIIPKKGLSDSKIDTLILVDCEYKFYSYEERDSLHVPNFYGEKDFVLLGEIEVDSVSYDLFTVYRKAEVCDGFHYTSLLLFRNEEEEIEYVVLNDDVGFFLDVYQNKIVIQKENGVYCFEAFEGFADEMMFGCGGGLLQR